MRGHGQQRGRGASPLLPLRVLAGFLVVLGLLGMHGLMASHSAMPGAAAVPAQGIMHSASHGGSPMAAADHRCPTPVPCPAAAASTVCVLAPPAAAGSWEALPGDQPSLQPAAACGGLFPYRGPPSSAPSLHRLSISRT